MDWLPVCPDFRDRLRAVAACTDRQERVAGLAALAGSRLGYVELLQLDRAIAGMAGNADGRLRVALLGACTIDHLAPAIRVAGLRHGLLLEVQSGHYGQYRRELLEADSWLHAFAPDIVVLCPSARNLVESSPIAADEATTEAAIAAEIGEWQILWSAARRAHPCLVVQQNFLDVFEPLFGSLDAQLPAAPARLVARLNERLARAAAAHGVALVDAARAAARDGIAHWFDPARWLHGRFEIAPSAAPRFGELVARVISALRGRSRKCLVLDLDNTLWGGVVGDVGIEGLELGPGSAVGEAHLALQRYAKRLADRGIVLAVCSKNDTALAERAFREHPEMLLDREDIAAFVANWHDKAENLRAIAAQLNLGLDALVFVDDNPAERARIRQSLPMIAVPELPPDPALYVRCLGEAGYFEATAFTADDRERAAQYQANARRDTLRAAAQTMDEFLRGLSMTVVHGPVQPVDVARATQLLNKTNQFNTTTRRYSVGEVAALASDPAAVVWQFRLVDRFGDNGIVSVVILRTVEAAPTTMEIENWVMSCRVFGRQLEIEAMNILVEIARARGLRALVATFRPTERNGVVRNLFADLGFSRADAQASEGDTTRWCLRLQDRVSPPTFILRQPAPT